MTAEFVVNNKIYIATKVLSFIANYGRELRMGTDIRKKGKVEKMTEFVERMKKSTGGDRNSIKESTERYEEVGG